MRIILFLCLLFVFSCGTRNYDEQYLYDKVGFKGDRRPVTSSIGSKTIHSIAPTRQDPINNYHRGGYNQGYNQPVGGSRFYSNPYAIPPAQIPPTQIPHPQQGYQGGYNNYKVYDADRFYVPPNSYRYIEKPVQQRPSQFGTPSCDFGC